MHQIELSSTANKEVIYEILISLSVADQPKPQLRQFSK